MQRFKKTIGYLLLSGFFLSLSPFTNPVHAQQFADQPMQGESPGASIDAPCKIVSGTIATLNADGFVPLNVKTTNCTGSKIEIVAKYPDNTFQAYGSWTEPGNHAFFLPDPTGSTDLLLTRGEDACTDGNTPDCKIKIVLTPHNGDGQPVKIGDPFTLPGTATYNYNCSITSKCSSTKKWAWTTTKILNETCQILSAQFDNSKDTGYVGQDDGNTKYVTAKNGITVTTKNCAGQPIYVSLVEGDNPGPSDAVNVLNNKKILVPAGESVHINLRVGEEHCDAATEPDCVYHIIAGTKPFESLLSLGGIYYSLDKSHGRLAYLCDGVCLDNWVYVGDNGDQDPANLTDVTNSGTLGDPNSACLDKKTGKPIEGCYELYGGLAEVLKGKLDLVDNKFDTLKANSLGGLINGIIAFAIGIAGVLAVGMIMYEGFLYMKTDNVNAKIDEKGRILKTTLGFLLLLFIYAGLRTINPDLLNLNPSITAITLKVAPGQDPNEVLDAAIQTNPNLAKIYATSKGHWRDGGSVNPSDETSRKAVVDAASPSNFTDIAAAGVTVKSGAGKLVEKTVAPKIIALNTALKAKGISMTVTEAWKPTTYKHYAACQYTGTCVDADIPFDATKVATFISTAQSNGLVAVWETEDKGEYSALLKAGVPQSNVMIFEGSDKGHITGSHSSVYDYK